MAKLAFIENVKTNQAAFAQRVTQIADKLGFDPDDLMAVMYLESGLNPKAVNPNGGATGLIQFMPATAQAFGTSTAALLNMSNIQQLDWVEKFYSQPFLRGKMNSFPDLYLATFAPAYLGKADTVKFPANYAKFNPGFDLNKDNALTVGEFREAVYKRLPKAYVSYFKKKVA